MRWLYETDGMADGLVVVHEDDLGAFTGLAPEMVVLVDRETARVTAYWHLETGAFVREAEVGIA